MKYKIFVWILTIFFLIGILIAKTAAQSKQEEPQTQEVVSLEENLKSTESGDPQKIRNYLETIQSKFGVGSPLAEHADLIAKSEFWALIIAVCHPEQYNCTKAPFNNYWGMMTVKGGLRHFASISDGITYMDGYFHRIYSKKQTVESLRNYYCVSQCIQWEETVIKVKNRLESL